MVEEVVMHHRKWHKHPRMKFLHHSLMLKTLIFIALTSVLHAQSVKLIFDTDMGNDVDDAQALAMIHSLQSRGTLELLAVTSTKDHPLSAPFTDALNTFYGCPKIRIAACAPDAALCSRERRMACAVNPRSAGILSVEYVD